MKKINFLAILLGGILSAQTTFTLVKDINPGVLSASPANFTTYNGKLYFSANSTINGTNIGNELWESDGTDTGTKLVADINPGTPSSSPANLFTFNDKIYFSGGAFVNGASTYGLLQSYDPTNGVQIISSNARNATNFGKVGNTLYFKASNLGVNPSTERMYYLNTSGEAIIADDNLKVNAIGYVANKVIANAQLTNATNPSWMQLFGFDGTTTSLVKNINTSASRYPQNFYYSQALGKSFFGANGGNGTEPWITDGTEAGTVNLKDINTSNASAGSGPSNFTEYNGKVYFSASNGLTNGAELWVTDGTEAGTYMVKDIIPGSNGTFPEKMVVYKNKLYFLLTNTNSVRQLWETDGTEDGTKLVSSFGSASMLLTYNNNLYVVARISNSDQVGIELYKVNLADDTLAVSDVTNSKISIYPNPSKGDFNISNIKAGSFELYDFSGRLVKSGNFSDSKISTSSEAGNYILKVTSDDKKVNSTTKVIIQ